MREYLSGRDPIPGESVMLSKAGASEVGRFKSSLAHPFGA